MTFWTCFQLNKLSILFSTIVIAVVIGCNYDNAPFYYADIKPNAPSNIKVIFTNTSSATVKWTIANDDAYPSPKFSIYTILSNQTRVVTNLSITVSYTNQAKVSNLSSKTTYSAFVQSTNKAGTANSSTVTFTTH